MSTAAKMCLMLMAASTAQAKQVLVTGGVLRSHHLAVVPVVEGLLERGHNVTFALPNTSEARGWFPEGIGSANLVFLGDESASVSAVKFPDMKNLRWYERIPVWSRMIWNGRSILEKPLLSMLDDFLGLLENNKFDVAFSSAMSISCNALLKSSSLPFVGFVSLPPIPQMVLSDTEEVCKYPNFWNPRSVPDLQSSLLKRAQNRVECMLQRAFFYVGFLVINSVLQSKGLEPARDFSHLFLAAPWSELDHAPYSASFVGKPGAAESFKRTPFGARRGTNQRTPGWAAAFPPNQAAGGRARRGFDVARRFLHFWGGRTVFNTCILMRN